MFVDNSDDGAERRRERRFEGELQAIVAAGQAGAVRAHTCTVTSLSPSGIVLSAPIDMKVGDEIWVDIPGFEIVRCAVEQKRGAQWFCRPAIDKEAKNRLAVWVSWLARRRNTAVRAIGRAR